MISYIAIHEHTERSPWNTRYTEALYRHLLWRHSHTTLQLNHGNCCVTHESSPVYQAHAQVVGTEKLHTPTCQALRDDLLTFTCERRYALRPSGQFIKHSRNVWQQVTQLLYWPTNTTTDILQSTLALNIVLLHVSTVYISQRSQTEQRGERPLKLYKQATPTGLGWPCSWNVPVLPKDCNM
jgi:hypothetical protein